MAKEGGSAEKLDVTRQQLNTPVPGLYSNDLTPQSLYKSLTEQCRAEWEYCWRVQNGKVQKWLNRLRLYNNQKRDDDVVGDPLLFTIMNSIIAALYDDELNPEWVGRNEGNEDLASNLNNLSSYDKDEMVLDQLRYFWWWDTGFFGKGFVGMTAFDRKKMCPVPELIDPTTFQQDPEAFSLNGDMMGRNSARFCGREILLTKYQMEKIPSVFDIDYVRISKSTNSLLDQARQSRQDAQGLNQQIRTEEKDLGVNAYYQITEWMTHFKDDNLTGGQIKKVLVWLANDRHKVVRFKILPQQDRWMITERSLYPTAHDFYGTSIPDLVEDKQRMRAILTNLGVNLLKSDLFGMYLYDRNHIKTRSDLNFDFNKFIGVDLGKGDSLANIVQPMPRQNGNQNYFNLIMQTLDLSAQKATATPDMQQGQLSKKNQMTATELNKADQNVAKRYSLAAKIASWSEKDFWEQWYYLYKKYFKSTIDEKVVRIQGIFAPAYPVYTREMIIGKTDPDVKIKSKYVVESKRDKNRALWNEYSQVVLQDPDANKRYLIKKLGKLHDATPEEIEQLLPPTPDERKAREENITLNKNKFVQVQATDNHMQHLQEHAKARRTKELYAHIATHLHALELAKTNPQQGQQPGQQQQGGQQPGQPPQGGGTPPQLKGMGGQQPNQPPQQGGGMQQQ
jgi:hypothetical protein